MKQITINSSFEDILGTNKNDLSENERKQRWLHWQELAIKNGDSEIVETWAKDFSTCEDCIHLDKSMGWCNSTGLPNTVNPILSFQHGIVGMACMGAGKQTANEI